MPLFGRRRAASTGGDDADESLFTYVAADHGLEPATAPLFDRSFEDAIHEVALVLHGASPRNLSNVTGALVDLRLHLHDAFRTERDGRAIVVANGGFNINPGLVGTGFGRRQVAVCVVELPSVLALACVQPRRYRQKVVAHVAETPTGNAAFDERFSTFMFPGMPQFDLTADLQQLLMARDDWIFRPENNQLVCVSEDPFASVDEMLQRIDQVQAVVGAIPTAVLSTRVVHSEDDLLVRIGRLDSVEDAIAFLQELTPADRERLAHSDTPLAAFADVTTPEEAIARFQALASPQQIQLISMFESAEGNS